MLRHEASKNKQARPGRIESVRKRTWAESYKFVWAMENLHAKLTSEVLRVAFGLRTPFPAVSSSDVPWLTKLCNRILL